MDLQVNAIAEVKYVPEVDLVADVVAGDDAHIVDFDGDNDREDPLNWTKFYKWSMVVLISFLSLVVNLAILLCAPTTPSILAEFKSNNKLDATLLVSIWELGEVLGPLVVAPLSETWGRLPVYHTANVLFVVFSIVAARSTSMGMLIAMRFLLGMSVASTVVNPCIVGDIFREEQRGKALSIMGIIPFIAPVVGQSIGGVISEALGWRWKFWLIAIIAGPLQVLLLVTFRETYRVRILKVKAARLREKTGDLRLRSKYEKDRGTKWMPIKTMLRPLKLLMHSPVVLLVSMIGGIAMSLVYVIVTSLPDVYEQRYGFNKNVIGLTYWGLGIGMIFSTLTVGPFVDWYLLHQRQKGKECTENRLPTMIMGSALIRLGLLCFGWTVQYEVHWIAPIFLSSLVGYGFVSVAISSWAYLVDAFGIYAASATAATVLLRNAGAAGLPLAGPALVGRVGHGWAFSALALLGIGTVPIAVALMYTGQRLRSLKSHKRLIE